MVQPRPPGGGTKERASARLADGGSAHVDLLPGAIVALALAWTTLWAAVAVLGRTFSSQPAGFLEVFGPLSAAGAVATVYFLAPRRVVVDSEGVMLFRGRRLVRLLLWPRVKQVRYGVTGLSPDGKSFVPVEFVMVKGKGWRNGIWAAQELLVALPVFLLFAVFSLWALFTQSSTRSSGGIFLGTSALFVGFSIWAGYLGLRGKRHYCRSCDAFRLFLPREGRLRCTRCKELFAVLKQADERT